MLEMIKSPKDSAETLAQLNLKFKLQKKHKYVVNG